MRRRTKPTTTGASSPIPDDLAAGPVLDVWADADKWAAHRRGEVDHFDPALNARRRWQQAAARWVAAQPDPSEASEALRRVRHSS